MLGNVEKCCLELQNVGEGWGSVQNVAECWGMSRNVI